MKNTIIATNIEDMTKIVSGLVREGIVFAVEKRGHDWYIICTGGY